MRELPNSLVSRLKLREAAEEEAAAWRNLLPTEPWVGAVAANPGSFARLVATRLRAGHRNAPAFIVDARKPHQATRPVPIVGVAERIAYRALTSYVLESLPLAERGRAEYREFVYGPFRDAFGDSSRFRLSNSAVDYVVQADISAFYQYIDHGVLLSELEVRTGLVDESRFLIELLGEIQGASYGLPQLLGPSDALSEVYAGILHREVTRRVGRVWRFNDDFRMTANGYGNAQQRLEDLAASARPLGLVLNERKTRILKFETYFWRNLLSDEDEGDIEVRAEDVGTDDDDYSLDTGGSLGLAERVLDRLDDGSPTRIEVEDADADAVRALRKALRIMTEEQSDGALKHVKLLFQFVPELTPRLSEYLIAAHRGGHEAVDVWYSLLGISLELNAWQKAWLAFVSRECGYSDPGVREWLRDQIRSSAGGLLQAEATLALALSGEFDTSSLDVALRMQPEALAPWYAAAINASTVPDDLRRAIRASSPLLELLISVPE